jgi:hypothetical protein
MVSINNNNICDTVQCRFRGLCSQSKHQRELCLEVNEDELRNCEDC